MPHFHGWHQTCTTCRNVAKRSGLRAWWVPLPWPARFISRASRDHAVKESMAQSSTTLHESNLPPEIVDRHRAIVSLMEELEAVDWYDQRVHATTDEALRALLAHNRD